MPSNTIFVCCALLCLLGICNSTPRNKTEAPLLEDFDSLGAWFDEVALIDSTTIPRQPNVTIGIVGAGISGLAIAMMLDSVGVHNWEIIEASHRVGGRFRTKFFEGTQEYAEMGPMRLPYRIKYKSDNSTHYYTDHALTFQLGDWLNEMNRNDPKYKINFIPWIQHHPNEILARGTKKTSDGRYPTRAEIAANASLGLSPPSLSAEYNTTKRKLDGILKSEQTLKAIQQNVWRVHGQAMNEGYDDISQQSLLRNSFGFGASENTTDIILGNTDYDILWDEMHHNSNLAQDGSRGTLGETEWKCVENGFDRISEAFVPFVKDKLRYNSPVRKIETREEGNRSRTHITWSNGLAVNSTETTKAYDYTILSAPFTMTRFMELPSFSSVKTRAMAERGLRFKDACKLALLFKERFWEKGDRPIFGGYSQPKSVPVGALYYPVYGLNQSRPGVIIQYRGGDWSSHFTSMSDEQYVKMVLDSIASIHGEQARELYTGDYERVCWLQDEWTSTSWTRPNVEQHKLYIPTYHQTEKNVILIGEHTAPTHAWVSSSLYSSVRGAIQLLLEIGMVTEAKALNERWMGRWIHDDIGSNGTVISPIGF